MSKILAFAGLVIWMFTAQTAFAQDPGKLISDSQYFSVYSQGAIDEFSLLTKLNYNYLVYGDTMVGKTNSDIANALAKNLDALYLEVSDILDIHIYNYKGVIVIVPDQAALAQLLKKQFDLDFKERSIYYHEKSTIFISAADLTVGMLGHEMAHALISNFFIVPPPPKVQEVLSGYVEYTLLKAHGS